jgi:hypothetical protein
MKIAASQLRDSKHKDICKRVLEEIQRKLQLEKGVKNFEMTIRSNAENII